MPLSHLITLHCRNFSLRLRGIYLMSLSKVKFIIRHLIVDLTRSQTFDEGDDDVFVDKVAANKVPPSTESEAEYTTHPGAPPRSPVQLKSVSCDSFFKVQDNVTTS